MAQLFQIWSRRMVMEELDILGKTGDETIEIWIVHLKVQAKTFEPFSFPPLNIHAF
jgi:hypothetical protein